MQVPPTMQNGTPCSASPVLAVFACTDHCLPILLRDWLIPADSRIATQGNGVHHGGAVRTGYPGRLDKTINGFADKNNCKTRHAIAMPAFSVSKVIFNDVISFFFRYLFSCAKKIRIFAKGKIPICRRVFISNVATENF